MSKRRRKKLRSEGQEVIVLHISIAHTNSLVDRSFDSDVEGRGLEPRHGETRDIEIIFTFDLDF